jgi:hypothetical protein
MLGQQRLMLWMATSQAWCSPLEQVLMVITGLQAF